ncbi:hypothetical protein ACFFGT_25530 [Mucilaginibacter angelicae]|uniref:Uncharacterized protein n=1 Tax=Mucilaginibacter angelicae TaxID=869718 RepID=A0ABV6LDN8_9SPHI
MFNHLLIEQSFPTPIGIVKCGISSTYSTLILMGHNTYENGRSVIYRTLSHIVEVITFKRRLPLYNGESVKDCQGWIWRITKESGEVEHLQLNCLISDIATDVILLGSDPGEHLDSFAANNDSWITHIGSEDGEVMHYRALNDDWMPSRYKDALDFTTSFTSIQSNGLSTLVPDLREGERIHFHYLAAYDEYSEIRVNTWFAVDETKRNLENWIGIW